MTRSNGIRKTDEIPISDMDDASVTREAIRDELGAQNSYSQYARQTKDPKAKRVYKDISREEGEHVGELAQVYSEQDPDAVKDMNEGRKEVKDMKSAKKSGAQPNKKSGHIEKYSNKLLDRLYANKEQAPMPDTAVSTDIPQKGMGGSGALAEMRRMRMNNVSKRAEMAINTAKQMAVIKGIPEGKERDRFIAETVAKLSNMYKKNYDADMAIKREAISQAKAEEREAAEVQPVSDAKLDSDTIIPTGHRPDGVPTAKKLPALKPKTISPTDGKKKDDDGKPAPKKLPPSKKTEESPKGQTLQVKTFPERPRGARNEHQRPIVAGTNNKYNRQGETSDAEANMKQTLQNYKDTVEHLGEVSARESQYGRKNKRSQKRRAANGSLNQQGLERKDGKNVKKEPTSKKTASASMPIKKFGELSGRPPVKERPGGDWNFQTPEQRKAMRAAADQDRSNYLRAQRDFKERHGRNPTDIEAMRRFYSTMPLVQDFLEYVPEKKRGFRGRGFPTGHAFPDIDWQHVPGVSPVIPTYIPKLAREDSSKKGYFRIVRPSGTSSVILDTDDHAYEKAMRAMKNEKDPDTGRPQGRQTRYKITGIEGEPEGTYIEPIFSNFRSYRLSGKNKDRLMYYAALKDELPVDEVWVPSKWDYLHNRYGSYMPEFAVKFDPKKGEYVPAMTDKQIQEFLHDEYVRKYHKEPEKGMLLNRPGPHLVQWDEDVEGVTNAPTSDTEDMAYWYARQMAGDDKDIENRRSVKEWVDKFETGGGTVEFNVPEDGDFTITMPDGTISVRPMDELKEWSDYMFDARVTQFRNFIGKGGDMHTDFETISESMERDPGSWDDVIKAPRPEPKGIKQKAYSHFKADEWMEDPEIQEKFRRTYFSDKDDVTDEDIYNKMLEYANGIYEKLLAGDQEKYLAVMKGVDEKMFERYGVHLDDDFLDLDLPEELTDGLSSEELEAGKDVLAGKDIEYPEKSEGFGEFSSDPSIAANGRKIRDYWKRTNYEGSAAHRNALDVNEQQRDVENKVLRYNIEAVAKALETVNGVEKAWRGDNNKGGDYGIFSGFLNDVKTGKFQFDVDKYGNLVVLREAGGGTAAVDDMYTGLIRDMTESLHDIEPNGRAVPDEKNPQNALRVAEALSEMEPEDIIYGIEVPLTLRDGTEEVKRYDGESLLRMLIQATNRYARYANIPAWKRKDYDEARKILSYAINNDMDADPGIDQIRREALTEARMMPGLRNYSYVDPTTKKRVTLHNDFRNKGRKDRYMDSPLSRDDIGGHRAAYDEYSKIFGEAYPEVEADRDNIHTQLLVDKISKILPEEYNGAIQSEIDNAVKTLEAMGIEVTDEDRDQFEKEAIIKVNKDKLDWATGEITDAIVDAEIVRRTHQLATDRYVESKISNAMMENEGYRRKYSGMGKNDSIEDAMYLHDVIAAIRAGEDPESIDKEGYEGPKAQREFEPRTASSNSAESDAMDKFFEEKEKGQQIAEEKQAASKTPTTKKPSVKSRARAEERASDSKKESEKTGRGKGKGKGKTAPEKKKESTVPAPTKTSRKPVDVQGILHARDNEEETSDDMEIEDTFKSMSFRDIYNRRRNDVINKYRGI